MRYAERVLTFAATCRQQQLYPVDFLALAILAVRSGTPSPTRIATH
jgi:hypothetical protein